MHFEIRIGKDVVNDYSVLYQSDNEDAINAWLARQDSLSCYTLVKLENTDYEDWPLPFEVLDVDEKDIISVESFYTFCGESYNENLGLFTQHLGLQKVGCRVYHPKGGAITWYTLGRSF